MFYIQKIIKQVTYDGIAKIKIRGYLLDFSLPYILSFLLNTSEPDCHISSIQLEPLATSIRQSASSLRNVELVQA